MSLEHPNFETQPLPPEDERQAPSEAPGAEGGNGPGNEDGREPWTP